MATCKRELFYGIAIAILTAHISTVDGDRGDALAIFKDCLPNNRCMVKKITIDSSPPVDLNSCENRCQHPFNLFLTCQCDTDCPGHGDCCTDYADKCGASNVTDEELKLTGGRIFNADTDRLEVEINLQNVYGKGGENKTAEKCKYHLFTSIPEGVTTNPMYVKFTTLAQNYNRYQSVPEDFNSTQWQQVDEFLSEVTKSQSMVVAQKYLAAKGIVSSNMTVFESNLRDIWFTMYKRSNTYNSSSGFEHVFVGEVNDSSTNVEGFHNWVRFALLEQTENITYIGYSNTLNLTDNTIIISCPFYWDDYYKNKGSFFVGTSPAFDMAVFTLCFYARPNVPCNLTINAERFAIKTHTIKCNLENAACVGTSYPML